MEHEPAGAPAVTLIVSGVLGLLSSLLYLVWTFLPVMWGVFAVFAQISEKGFTGDAIAAAILFLATPVLQVMMFAVTTVTAIITLFAGIRFNQWRSKGLVWLGLLCSTATPVVAAMGNSASLLNLGSCGAGLLGCVTANALLLPVLVIGIVASVWGVVVLTSGADHFEA